MLQRLRDFREDRDISQQKMAELLNVAQVKAKLLTLTYIRDELDAMGIAY